MTRLALKWFFVLVLIGGSADAAEVNLVERAQNGDATAQFNLGSMYANGIGVPKDSAEAEKWYRKAAEQGHAAAQLNLGRLYLPVDGSPRDAVSAVKWFRKAAEQGYAPAQLWLAGMYEVGVGVPKDSIECLAWSNIAAASGGKDEIAYRDMIERRLGPAATLAAQRRSKEIMNEVEAVNRRRASSVPNSSAAPNSSSDEIPSASGTGAIVSATGYVLTAAHVVTESKNLKIITAQGVKTASVVRVDEANDIAVLKLEAGIYPALPVASSRKVRLGQTVATIGFPNIEIQGFSQKVTRGEISSLNGIGDDPRAWQISVPVQPGNSGGPLLDENGNVIGVVVSKLGLKAAQATGDIPQNVNYAVKSTYALALLEPYLESGTSAPNQSESKLQFEDMVARAQQSIVLILVY
jgi:S1-C subfamily serine protease